MAITHRPNQRTYGIEEIIEVESDRLRMISVLRRAIESLKSARAPVDPAGES